MAVVFLFLAVAGLAVVEGTATSDRLRDLGSAPIALFSRPPNTHEYVLSNRERTYWSADTLKTESRKWQGLVTKGWSTLLNVWMDTERDRDTQPKDQLYTTLTPFATKHHFPSYNESLWVPLGQDALMLRYDILPSSERRSVFFRPVIGMRKDWDTVVGPFPLDWADGLSTPNEPFLYVSTSLPRYSGPKWMAFAASEQGTFSKRERWPAREYPRDVYRHDDSGTKFAYEPGKTEFSDLTPNKPLYIVIALADTKLDAGALARTLLRSKEQSLNTLIADLTESETKLGIESDSASLDKAVKWAHATVDSLSMNVAGRGIYAGFHWFTQYWGRDSFISLQGAVLTSREFDLARQFIATMADAQDINFNSKTYGRVPNILQHPDAGANNYETADGTGFWIRGIWLLLEYGGMDTSFLTKLWPFIETALAGEMNRADSLGFLTHGDRETWMDASYQDVVVTKRGSRAVEIQALYFVELDIGYRLAKVLGKNDLSVKYYQAMTKIKQNFLTYFWNHKDSDLYDHLKADGTPGLQKRPNSIFAITVPLKDNPLIPLDKARQVFDSFLSSGLLAQHGVRTLSPSDKDYRPTHDETGQNHDLSYHNGDVWPWLSGHVAEAALTLNRLDVASQLLQISVLRILTIDTLGSIEEILDGTLPPGSDPFLGTSRGAMSQAWSVSEFLRAVHQGWFGITPRFAQDRVLELALVLPQYIKHGRINTPLGEGTGTVHYDMTNLTKRVTLEYVGMRRPFQVTLKVHRSPMLLNNSTRLVSGPGKLVKNWTVDEVSGWYKCTFDVDVTSTALNSVVMSVTVAA